MHKITEMLWYQHKNQQTDKWNKTLQARSQDTKCVTESYSNLRGDFRWIHLILYDIKKGNTEPLKLCAS